MLDLSPCRLPLDKALGTPATCLTYCCDQSLPTVVYSHYSSHVRSVAESNQTDRPKVCLDGSVDRIIWSILYLDRSNDCFGTSSKNLDRRPQLSLPLLQPTFAIPSRGHYVHPRLINGRLEISMAFRYPNNHQAAAHYPSNHQTTSPYPIDCQGTAYYPIMSSIRRQPSTLPGVRWQHVILSATPATLHLSYKLVRGTFAHEATLFGPHNNLLEDALLTHPKGSEQ